MKQILNDAAAVGNATGRALNWRMREKWAFCPGSAWGNMLFEGGYNFETAPPMVTSDGIKPCPTQAHVHSTRALASLCLYRDHSRHVYAVDRYWIAVPDGVLRREQELFRRAKTYKVTLPADIPAKAFCSQTLTPLELTVVWLCLACAVQWFHPQAKPFSAQSKDDSVSVAARLN
jgi:hypothetical protein